MLTTWLLRLLGLLALGVLPTLAQAAAPTSPPPDSARVLVFARRRPVVQIDSRYSIINHKFCTINGLKLGLEWRGRMRTGAAFYFLSSRIPTRLAAFTNAAADPNATLRFYNIALYSEYILIENPRWELGANLQSGLGSLRISYLAPNMTQMRTPHDFIGLVEPSLAAQLRVFSWMSLGAGAGWRQTLFVPPLVRSEISGPIFYVRAKILIGPLVRTVRRRQALFTQDGLRVNDPNHRPHQKKSP